MHLSRNILQRIIFFSVVFLTILNAQDTSRDTSSQNLSVAAKSDGKSAVPAAPQKEGTSSAAAAEPKEGASPLPQSEVDSIVQQFESTFVSATNRGDAKTLAGLYMPGATVLNEFGGLAVGRETMQRVLSAAFTNSGRPTIQETTRKSTAVSSNVIVTHGVLRVIPLPPDSPQDTLYTKVLTLDGDQWRIAAMQYAQPNPWNVTSPRQQSVRPRPKPSIEECRYGIEDQELVHRRQIRLEFHGDRRSGLRGKTAPRWTTPSTKKSSWNQHDRDGTRSSGALI